MKFQLAPCHRPPSSMVFMELMLVVISLRSPGRSHAQRPMPAATTKTPKATHQEPLRKLPNTATARIITKVAGVALRLPPRGMYR